MPAEDAVAADGLGQADARKLVIAAPMLSRIANFDDADPLRAEPNMDFRFIPPGQPLPREANAIIVPGTKSTRADLDFLRAQGWDIDIAAHVRAGGHVLGLCGGYQMLGQEIHDPNGVDGRPGSSRGLGLLDVVTRMSAEKQVRLVHGSSHFGAPVTGYEIHT